MPTANARGEPRALTHDESARPLRATAAVVTVPEVERLQTLLRAAEFEITPCCALCGLIVGVPRVAASRWR